MNNDFKKCFLCKNTNLQDLGSYPGGWSQVASKIITHGKILSIDIKFEAVRYFQIFFFVF